MIQKQDFNPVAVLKIYKQNHDNYYIEKHIVRGEGENKTLSPGEPLTEKQLKKIVRYISSEDKQVKPLLKNKWLEGNVLSVEPNPNYFHLMWYEPAMIRTINCIDSCSIPSGEYHFPALLYLVREDDFNIYAMKTDQKRPRLDTKLFLAPIMNTMSGYYMCWGNVKKGKTSFVIEEEIQRWSTALWKSNFAHKGSMTATKIPLEKAYEIAKKDRFPVKEMEPLNQTIKDLLRKL